MSSINLWYATRATGIAALVLLTVTMFLGILTAGRAKSALPAFARAEIHRRVSILTVTFLAIHILTSVLDTYVHIGWTSIVVPFTSSYHALWLALGTVGVDLVLAVAISSAFRQHITARTWRTLHGLSYLSWPIAIAHSLGMGTDSNLDWVLGLVAVCIASIVGVSAWRVLAALHARASLPATITKPRRSIRADVSNMPTSSGVPV
jgi:methionine sulfoxide reductase heme-binding subunit